MSKPVSGTIEEQLPMRTNQESSPLSRWIVFGTALVYFALGSLSTAHFMHLKEAWSDSHRVLHLEIHHGMPARVTRRLRSASRLQARQGLDMVRCWMPEGAKLIQTDPAFVYPTGDASQQEAKTDSDAAMK
jgi:hypothetical protein